MNRKEVNSHTLTVLSCSGVSSLLLVEGILLLHKYMQEQGYPVSLWLLIATVPILIWAAHAAVLISCHIEEEEEGGTDE